MSKLKWLKFGLSMAALGATAVTLPIALTSCNGDNSNSDSVENGEQAFREAVLSSGLVDLKDLSTPKDKCVYVSQDQPIEAIKNYFINKMSGTANKITVNPVTGSTSNTFQCTMSNKTLTYFANLFNGSWESIIGQSQNNDLKNIKQLSFGFDINTVTPSNNPDATKLNAYKIFPKFLQFSWDSKNKPLWLQNDSIRIQLSSGKYKNIVYVNNSTVQVDQTVSPAPTDGDLVFINKLTNKVTS